MTVFFNNGIVKLEKHNCRFEKAGLVRGGNAAETNIQFRKYLPTG